MLYCKCISIIGTEVVSCTVCFSITCEEVVRCTVCISIIDTVVRCIVDECLSFFQIGAGLYAVGRPVQKRNITQQKRTAKSAPITPCPSREGPYSTVFSVSRPMDPLMWLAGLLAISGDVEMNPGPTTQAWTCDMYSTEITRRHLI